MECLAHISSYFATVPARYLAPDVIALYLAAYCCSSKIRAYATAHAGAIADALKIDPTASVTVIGLIIAAVAILAVFVTSSNAHTSAIAMMDSEWLAFAALFAFAQLLLTRQVTGFTSYLADAATGSLWWCLSWSLWVLFQTLAPNAGWMIILAAAPVGVLVISTFDLKSMAQ